MSLGQPNTVAQIVPATDAPKLYIASTSTKLHDSANFTMMCWALHTGGTADAYSDLMAISDNNDVVGMGTHSTGAQRVFNLGDLVTDVDGLRTIPDGQWMHFCMTASDIPGTSTRVTGFLNGVEHMTGSLINPATPLYVRVVNSRASADDPGGIWIGNICGVKIWDGVVLTPEEIEREMWTFMPQRWDNLWACSPMRTLDTRTHNYGSSGVNWTSAGTYFAEGTNEPPGVTWDVMPYTVVYSPVPNIQLIPDSDVSAGTWTSTGANLFSVLDEAVTDDADKITSVTTPSNAVAEVGLINPATTTAGTTTIVVRVKKT